MATPTSIKLDEELKGRVQELADARRRSAHWLMREAIEQYVEREERREAFKQDAVRAWEEYQATGQYVHTDAVEHWLTGWGTEHETPPPKCDK
ncbi:Predicted transcriptional regulator [Thiohalospira halophila DSM 15071]|uniref:Predicted transcriptional regulator n=1 Tax=Thiohalospira halophila DSM 15071 TaxID=1123397 RepID=A0A1I1NGQ9_9GAMM|nr:CopG family ribbon-helix-helix protein [Thiohalospira halophila]SFC96819.1 Predicted transcriptional regulator [Thiohalospira halophila DSM 15071]